MEHFQHGIISAVIIYKILLYFLESDFNLNDDYIYGEEDARQFYIRREILRAIASHTCPDAYNIHITTFSSLLFLCDEFQEWGRKSWNELYTGLEPSSIALSINCFSRDAVDIEENIDMQQIKDDGTVIENICRIFERQYSLYKTTFRDGQDTAQRDFNLEKTIKIRLSSEGAENRNITIFYRLPADDESYFEIDLSSLSSTEKDNFTSIIDKKTNQKLYHNDLRIKR